MKRYETILIAVSDTPKEEIDGLIERYTGIIAGQKGIVVKADKWGLRRLAYKVRKQGRGFYILVEYVGDSAVVGEFERNLKFDDRILRFLTVKKQDQVDIKDIEAELAGKPEEKPDEEPEPAPPAAAQGEENKISEEGRE